MHRQKHQYRMQSCMGCNSRCQSRKGKERSVAAAHNDSREGDDSDHNEHHSHRAKAKALTAGDQPDSRSMRRAINPPMPISIMIAPPMRVPIRKDRVGSPFASFRREFMISKISSGKNSMKKPISGKKNTPINSIQICRTDYTI